MQRSRFRNSLKKGKSLRLSTGLCSGKSLPRRRNWTAIKRPWTRRQTPPGTWESRRRPPETRRKKPAGKWTRQRNPPMKWAAAWRRQQKLVSPPWQQRQRQPWEPSSAWRRVPENTARKCRSWMPPIRATTSRRRRHTEPIPSCRGCWEKLTRLLRQQTTWQPWLRTKKTWRPGQPF